MFGCLYDEKSLPAKLLGIMSEHLLIAFHVGVCI